MHLFQQSLLILLLISNGVASNELNISDNSNFYYIEVIEENCYKHLFLEHDNFEQQLIEFGYDDALDDSVFTINIKYLEYLKLYNDGYKSS